MVGPAKAVKTTRVLKMWHFSDLNITKINTKQKEEPKSSKKPKSQNFIIIKKCSPDEVKRPSDENIKHFNVTEVLQVKLDLCRVCLEDGAIPIHGDKPSEDLGGPLGTFGGIDINIFDSCPKYLCKPCHALLQGAILFRKTAQSSDQLLKMCSVPATDAGIKNAVDTNNKVHGGMAAQRDFETLFDKPTEESELDYCNGSPEDIIIEVPSILEPQVCVNTDHNYFNKTNSPDSATNISTSELEVNVTVQRLEKQHNFTCKQCNILFNSFEEYKHHKLQTRNHKNKVCSVCKLNNAVRCTKKYNQTSQKTGYIRVYVCDTCYENIDVVSQKPITDRFSNEIAVDNNKTESLRNQLNLTCKQCNILFNTFEDYKHHKLQTRNHKEKLCTVCKQTNAVRCSKKYNQTIQKTESIYVCDICYGNIDQVLNQPETNFMTKDFAMEHVNKALEEKKVVLTCKQCRIEFDKFQDYREHRLHTRKHKKKMCMVCNETDAVRYIRKYSLDILAKGVYVCDVCYKKDISELVKDLTDDKRNEGPSSFMVKQLKLKCKQCNISFSSYQECKLHKRLHDQKKRKTCPICNESYSLKYYRTHMQHHKNGGASYVCDICGKHLKFVNSFKIHRKTHFNILSYKCSICPYKTSLSQSLKIHIRSHTGERPYLCEECPQKFVSKSNLIKHRYTHKKERDFECKCGKKYRTEKDLKTHIKVDHDGIKEHICPICGQAYGLRKVLMKHTLRVHKREKLRGGRKPTYLSVETIKNEENMTI